MRKFAVLALCLLTAGCTYSISEMRQREPLASFDTKKAEGDVAKCILYAWQNESLAGVHYNVFLQPRPNGGTAVVNDGAREMADVYQVGAQTRVDVFSNGGNSSWIMKRRIASAQTCL